MPAQGRGANLRPGYSAVNTKLPKPKPAAKPPNPFKGLAPPTRSIEKAAARPVPKAGRSDKALKKEAQTKATNEFGAKVRQNIGEGMGPKKAVAQAVKSLTGKVGEAPVRGKTPVERQQERSERKEFKRQQKADVAKTVQPNFFGIPIGGKESPLEAAREKSRGERTPKSAGIVVPAGIPGLGKLAGLAAAGKGLSLASKAVPGVGPKHLVGEASELAAAPFLGMVAGGKAGLSAIEGNKAPAKKLIKGLGEGAAGEAIKGEFKKALETAKKHPELAAFELGGLTSAAGRLAGSSLRAAGSTAEARGARGALARAGSFTRPPIAMSEDAGLVKGNHYVKHREYSKDTGRKLMQVAADMRREPLRDEHNNVVTIHVQGREVPVLKGSPKEHVRYQKQRASFEAGTTQAVEHLEREGARRIAAKIEGVRHSARNWIKTKNVDEAVTRLTAGGTIKHVGSAKADVAKYVERVKRELKNEGSYRDTHELQEARQHVKVLEKALKNPNYKWDAPVQRGLEYGRALKQGDVRLKETNIFEPHELEHGALSEYALAHMKARWGLNEETGHEQLLGADKQPLSVEAIEAHAMAAGRSPETLGYVPHAVTQARPGAYHIPLKVGNRPVTPQHSRMGIVWGRGGMQMDTQILKDELVAKKIKANNAEAVDRVVKSAGVARPNGKYFTPREAVETARRLSVDTKVPYVAVRTVPAKLSPEMQKMIKDVQDPAALETAHHAMLNDRIIEDPNVGDQTANVVLMPRAHVQTLADHLMHPKDTERLLQMLNGPFRMAVLTQPRWLTGNFVEPYIVRLPLSGAGVNIPGSLVDFTAASKILDHMDHSGDPKMMRAALEIRAMQKGGLFVGRRGASLHRTWQGFSGNDASMLYAAHVVRNLPVTKQLGDLILTVPQTFFHVNRIIESTAQGIALGKSVRNDVQAITGSWLKSIKLGETAMNEVAKGMVDTATQHRFMEQQYQMLGQYAGFSPSVRRLVQSVFPFIPWTLNSVRFSYWTLPMHHTVAFSALARLANTVQAEWEAEHKNLPPGELKYTLKRKDEGLVNVARYTPFSVPISINQGDFQTITNQAFPVLSNTAEALKGKDFTGRELSVPKTTANPKGKATSEQKIEVAVNNFLESVVPLLSTSRRLREGGGTGYSTSNVLKPQVKPETKHGSAVARTFNPFQPVYLKKKTGSGERSERERPERERASRERPERER